MLLKNGTIYDGSGKPPFLGSVLFENDRISNIYVNNLGIENYKGKIIDCTGLIITPGFIDAHSHNDFFAAKADNLPYFLPFIMQGVTTMVTGNCGFSAAGYSPNSPYNHLVGGGLFSNDGNDYSDIPTWGQKITGNLPVNLVTLVGHGTVRIGINGKGNEVLSEEQLLEMDKVIETALQNGAAGVSFGLMYEPGQFAPYSELERIAKIVKKHQKIVTFHARACSKVSTSYQPPVGGRAHNLRAMDEVLQITKATGVKTEYSHLIFVGKSSWNTVDESLALLENAQAEGYDIMFDMYPMEFGASVITVVLPTWYLGMKPEKRKTPITKLRLAVEVFVAKKALGFGFHDILISNTYSQMPEIEGLRISEIAKMWKKSELKTYLEIIEKTNARVNVLMYRYQNQDIIDKLRKHPLSLYMTDAWIEKEAAIQNYACYYAFPKFLLLAKEHQEGLEDAISKMTGQTAKRFGIVDRGLIEPGKFADINVIDIDNLRYEENKAESPQGIRYVINNGKILMENGKIDKKIIQKSGNFIPIR